MTVARDWNYVVNTLLIELHFRPTVGAAAFLHLKDFNNIVFGMNATNGPNARPPRSRIDGILLLVRLLVNF